MTWFSELYKTYENNAGVIGRENDEAVLSPIAHMSAKAQVEVSINEDGEFKDAREIEDKAEQVTLIPVTESSASRSSGASPHALNDTLSYVAGDFCQYARDPAAIKCEQKHRLYMEALRHWNASGYSHPKTEAVFRFLEKNTLIHHLAECGIVKLDADGKLEASEKNGKYSYQKVCGNPYDKVMVRFRVFSQDTELPSATWEDQSLIRCYTNYYLSQMKGIAEVCYVRGKKEVISENHPKGIVSANYGAKLVSANDLADFTFRGRFLDSREACSISYEASQKAHNALTWLAKRQGITVGSQDKRTYICWNPEGKQVSGFGSIFSALEDRDENTANTEKEFQKKLYDSIFGREMKLKDMDDIVIIALDAATTGRLSVTYYNVLKASDYYERLTFWKESCSFIYYDYNQKKNMVRSPALREIVNYAFGTEQGNFVTASDKVCKEQTQRLLHCAADRAYLPADIMHALVMKASNPQAYSRTNYNYLLFTVCALIRKYYIDHGKGELVKMSLDVSNKDRSYLFGRLLAVLEHVEKSTYGPEDTRETNAVRLHNAFVHHPMYTWKVIEDSLNPYYQQLSPGAREYHKKIIQEITEILDSNYSAETLNRSLEETYLLGYYLQRAEFYKKKDAKETNKNEVEETK